MIEVRGLHKAYGDVMAVRGVDLDVEPGTIFAFLGPNGAGKTSTLEILEGFRDRDGGSVSVLGEDPATAGAAWRARIGVVLQESEPFGLLTVREGLTMVAGYYPSPRAVGETIALVGLAEQADVRASKLSGGQKRRLDVAMALIGDPELLFLDEPTTGFDPAARREAWDVIAQLRDLGKTVLLTTHYMEEADRLADRLAIIKAGEIVAAGTTASLTEGRDEAVIRFTPPPGNLPLAARPGPHGTVEIVSADAVADLAALTAWAQAGGHALPDLIVRRATLEDIYLELTA